jgi:hypothetical protein
VAAIRERIRNDGTRVFNVQVQIQGYPSRSASFRTRRDAERWAKTIEAQMIEGRHFRIAEARRRSLGAASVTGHNPFGGLAVATIKMMNQKNQFADDRGRSLPCLGSFEDCFIPPCSIHPSQPRDEGLTALRRSSDHTTASLART